MTFRANALCALALAACGLGGCSPSDITGDKQRDKLGAVGTARLLNTARPVLKFDRGTSPQASAAKLNGTSRKLERAARKVGTGKCQRTLASFRPRLIRAARIAVRYGPASRQYTVFVARNLRPLVTGVSRNCR